MPIAHSKIVAAGVAGALAATGIGLAGPADAAAHRGTTHVKATKKHTVTVAKSMRPGLAHLHNDGSSSVLVVRKKHQGADKLASYLNSSKDSDGERVLTKFTVVDLLDRHADHYDKLVKGTYYFVAEATKVKAANIRTVTVSGKRVDAVRPASTRSLVIGRNGALDGSTTAAVHPYLRVRNTTKQVEFLTILPVPASMSDADFDDLLAHPTQDKLDPLFKDFDGASDVIAFPNQDVTQQSSLGAGRYLVVSLNALVSGTPVASQLHKLVIG